MIKTIYHVKMIKNKYEIKNINKIYKWIKTRL